MLIKLAKSFEPLLLMVFGILIIIGAISTFSIEITAYYGEYIRNSSWFFYT
jgi:hypothetical protein